MNKLAQRAFSGLVKHMQTKHKLCMTSQIRQVTASVKAFESLKKNVLFSRVKRELEIKAMLHLASNLKHKALRAFEVALMRRILFNQVRERQVQRMA